MSRCLLDTNAWSMALVDRSRLPKRILAFLESAEEVSVSAVSLYEIGQKARLGKWEAMHGIAPTLIDIAERDNYLLLPVTPLLAIRSAMVNWDHKDPFDRIIGVTALSENVPLISSDRAFDQLEGVERIWA